MTTKDTHNVPEQEQAAQRVRSDWKTLVDKLSYKAIVNNIPFLAFVVLLAVLYISNSQRAVDMQRELKDGVAMTQWLKFFAAMEP